MKDGIPKYPSLSCCVFLSPTHRKLPRLPGSSALGCILLLLLYYLFLLDDSPISIDGLARRAEGEIVGVAEQVWDYACRVLPNEETMKKPARKGARCFWVVKWTAGGKPRTREVSSGA